MFYLNIFGRHIRRYHWNPVAACESVKQMAQHVSAVDSIVAVESASPRVAQKFELYALTKAKRSFNTQDVMNPQDFNTNLDCINRKYHVIL